jgi:hypothetical protein
MDLTGERVHCLKCWPEYFAAIDNGDKTFELRKDDRDYRVGDYLQLYEWHPCTEQYTGKTMLLEVTYVLTASQFGLAPGHACMAIKVIEHS